MQQKKKTVDSDSGSTCSFICKYIIYIFRILRTITHTIFAGHENEHVVWRIILSKLFHRVCSLYIDTVLTYRYKCVDHGFPFSLTYYDED